MTHRAIQQKSLPPRGDSVASVRLYQPQVLLAYFALAGLPVGLVLYGLNVARRGQRRLGWGLSALSAVTFVLFAAAPAGPAAAPGHLSAFSLSVNLLGLLVGIGVLKSESNSYRTAVARGARPARWWPPALAAIAVWLAVELSWTLLGTRAR